MSAEDKFSGATIVLSIALPEEFDEVRAHFPYKSDFSTDRHIRLELDISQPGFRLIAVLAATMGAQAALEAVEEAIEDFDPTVVICLGISGALSDDLQLETFASQMWFMTSITMPKSRQRVGRLS